jgi:hypothetical protein
MSNVEAPNVNADGEITNQELLSEQSGMPNMSSTKTFTVDTNMQVNGDLDVTGTVTATSFIGDGSQLTGISGGGPQSEIIDGNAFVRIEDGDPDGDSAAPVNLKMVSIGGTDLWDVDVSALNDINISSGDDITISAGDWMELQTQNEFYITSGDKIDLETDEYIELNGDVYLRDGHPLRLQDDFAGVNPGMESFVQDLSAASSTQVPSSIAVKSVTDDLQSQINNFSGGGGLDSAGVTALINEPYLRDTLYDVATAQTNIGLDAGFASTSNFSIAIGKESGINSGNATNSIALGFKAGQSISDNSIMIGRETGEVGASSYSVGIGTEALGINAGAGSVAIGYFASKSSAGSNSVAVGRQTSATGDNAIAIGNTVTATTADAVTIGSSVAGRMTYDTTNDWTFGAAVTAPAFVGDGSGLTGLPSGGGLDSAATIDLIGMQNKPAGDNSIQITPDTSTLNGDNNNIIIGTQISDMAGIGPQAVAMGYDIGAQSNGVSIGYQAGAGSQSTNSGGVFIGSRTNYFGNSNPADYAIAIGHEAGAVYPGVGSIALGKDAGKGSSGDYTVAIGYNANNTSNFNNTIMIKADGTSAYNSTAQYDIDIRTSAAGSLSYNTTNDWTFGAGVTMTDLTASGATVVFSNLPTTDPVNAGQLWNDNGTLKVSAG